MHLHILLPDRASVQQRDGLQPDQQALSLESRVSSCVVSHASGQEEAGLLLCCVGLHGVVESSRSTVHLEVHVCTRFCRLAVIDG